MIKTLIVLFFLSYETNLVFAQNETKIVEGCEVCQMVRAGKDFDKIFRELQLSSMLAKDLIHLIGNVLEISEPDESTISLPKVFKELIPDKLFHTKKDPKLLATVMYHYLPYFSEIFTFFTYEPNPNPLRSNFVQLHVSSFMLKCVFRQIRCEIKKQGYVEEYDFPPIPFYLFESKYRSIPIARRLDFIQLLLKDYNMAVKFIFESLDARIRDAKRKRLFQRKRLDDNLIDKELFLLN